MCENNRLKVSCPTDMSPTASLAPAVSSPGHSRADSRGRGVPGVVGDWVGTREGYTGLYPVPTQDPYLTIFSLKAHTYGQMKAILSIS